jgi:hypothetical protein
LIAKKRQNISDIHEEAGIDADEQLSTETKKEKIDAYFIELLKNGKFMEKLNDLYSIELLKEFSIQRNLTIYERTKDNLINNVLRYFLCKILNVSIESEREYLEKIDMLKNILTQNSIKIEADEGINSLYRKYVQFMLGDKYIVTKSVSNGN